jgi:hypothetical protein
LPGTPSAKSLTRARSENEGSAHAVGEVIKLTGSLFGLLVKIAGVALPEPLGA